MARIIKAAMGYPEIPAGFPILVWERMAIIEPAFAYLIDLATIPGRSHAVETVRTYGEHLHDWFDSLEQSGLDWRAVSEADIAAYRNRMLSQPSPHTRRPYARSTVNDRVRSICRFYAWAHGRGWIEALPFHFVDVRVTAGRRQPFLAHVDPRPGLTAANILTVAEHERLPRPLRVDQLRLLFARLEMPYRLMAEWALATGLRRKELCGLAIFQVPETAQTSLLRRSDVLWQKEMGDISLKAPCCLGAVIFYNTRLFHDPYNGHGRVRKCRPSLNELADGDCYHQRGVRARLPAIASSFQKFAQFLEIARRW